MKQFHVISLSIGTCLLLIAMSVFVVAGFVFATLNVHPQPRPDVFRPKGGVIGEVESTINELKYGPVNVQALKETKNGLFSRIRARRQATQVCQPCTQSTQTITYSYPAVSYATPVVSYSTERYLPTSVPTERVAVGVEMPAIANPVEIDASDCATCKKDPRSELKTGSFLCSNCRKSNVGSWHTEWTSEGTPVTFLCESCWQRLNEEQRQKAYKGYIARQSKSVGVQGLLHQELGQ
jgi:hypothetical protein